MLCSLSCFDVSSHVLRFKVIKQGFIHLYDLESGACVHEPYFWQDSLCDRGIQGDKWSHWSQQERSGPRHQCRRADHNSIYFDDSNNTELAFELASRGNLPGDNTAIFLVFAPLTSRHCRVLLLSWLGCQSQPEQGSYVYASQNWRLIEKSICIGFLGSRAIVTRYDTQYLSQGRLEGSQYRLIHYFFLHHLFPPSPHRLQEALVDRRQRWYLASPVCDLTDRGRSL